MASARRSTILRSQLDELMKHVKGPDFPTGCAICGISGVKQYLETGRGSMKVRGKVGRGGTQGRQGTDRHHGNSIST